MLTNAANFEISIVLGQSLQDGDDVGIISVDIAFLQGSSNLFHSIPAGQPYARLNQQEKTRQQLKPKISQHNHSTVTAMDNHRRNINRGKEDAASEHRKGK